jgi:hypothetical protein
MDTGTFVLLALSLCAVPQIQQPEPAVHSLNQVAGTFARRCQPPVQTSTSQTTHSLREALTSVRFDPAPASSRGQVGIVIGGMAGRKGPSGIRGVLTRLAVIGGLLGGGALGVAIEGDSCKCDDPGLAGFLIGAPIGAIAAGVLVWNLTK